MYLRRVDSRNKVSSLYVEEPYNFSCYDVFFAIYLGYGSTLLTLHHIPSDEDTYHPKKIKLQDFYLNKQLGIIQLKKYEIGYKL